MRHAVMVSWPVEGSMFQVEARNAPARRRRRGMVCGLLLTLIVGLVTAGAANRTRLELRRQQCHWNFENLGKALWQFHESCGHFPAAVSYSSRDGRPLLSWRVALLPYLGYRELFDRFHLDEPWDSPRNLALLGRMPAVYACPSEPDTSLGMTTYQVVVGPEGSMQGAKPLFERTRGVDVREVTDGTSNTLMVVETPHAVPWTKPEDLYFAEDQPTPTFGSRHGGGYHAAFADAAVRFLKFNIDSQLLRGLVTRDGNEVVGGG